MSDDRTISESYTAIYSEDQDKTVELGFEEKIKISEDFSPEDVKMKVDDHSFLVYGKKEDAINKESNTYSSHTFGYKREFDRKIRNVEMEVGVGAVSIYGEFED